MVLLVLPGKDNSLLCSTQHAEKRPARDKIDTVDNVTWGCAVWEREHPPTRVQKRGVSCYDSYRFSRYRLDDFCVLLAHRNLISLAHHCDYRGLSCDLFFKGVLSSVFTAKSSVSLRVLGLAVFQTLKFQVPIWPDSANCKLTYAFQLVDGPLSSTVAHASRKTSFRGSLLTFLQAGA
eukprot:1650508-Rhodomonas_salina.1